MPTGRDFLSRIKSQESKVKGRWMGVMMKLLFSRVLLIVTSSMLFGTLDSRGQANPPTREEAPMRVALAGLVHGHASGFFEQFQHPTYLQIAGIAEADRQLVGQFAKRYGMGPGLFYSDLEEMLKATHPLALRANTDTSDHRRVVEVYGRSVVLI